ncbi:hypothetical protein YUYDRAFT_01423 [Streptomyces sp. ScaeMP-e48]|uniref:DUF2087 domain-containing protein n=1 Tax=Streptomyces sp. ScaeMP-e48 TaxID=1100823 RepID=UPI000823AD03|nr:DUF2087 domain-containing protein [Streptomyces sp. ScaeMP-e48]SCK15313.1 hypothetical protein YUYDRAFT_01423 [Streptomyces sp. ScaeMP-e48]
MPEQQTLPPQPSVRGTGQVTAFFSRGRSYTEREVNEALLTVHEDCSALRRHLVVAGLLVRPRDGSSYRRVR